MNAQDTQKLLDQIERSYDDTAILMIELSEEIKSLEVKFGAASKLVATKKIQLATIARMFDCTRAYVEHLMQVVQDQDGKILAIQMHAAQIDTGLPVSKIAQLAGIEGDELKKWQDLDKIDSIVRRAREALQKAGIMSTPPTHLEMFIFNLKGE